MPSCQPHQFTPPPPPAPYLPTPLLPPQVSSCAKKLCDAATRPNSFSASACPLDTDAASLSAANVTFHSLADPGSALLAALGSPPPASLAAYCEAEYGAACGVGLSQGCPSVQYDGLLGEFYVDLSADSCQMDCVMVGARSGGGVRGGPMLLREGGGGRCGHGWEAGRCGGRGAGVEWGGPGLT